MAGVKMELTGYDELMAKLDKIETTLADKIRGQMVAAAGEIVIAKAKTLVRHGDPRHHPEAKQLADTIGMVVRDYKQRSLAVVGPEYPAGAHGHLLEFGHDIVPRGEGKVKGASRAAGAKKKGGITTGRARPFPFLRPAFDSTKGQQVSAMESVMARAVKELDNG